MIDSLLISDPTLGDFSVLIGILTYSEISSVPYGGLVCKKTLRVYHYWYLSSSDFRSETCMYCQMAFLRSVVAVVF